MRKIIRLFPMLLVLLIANRYLNWNQNIIISHTERSIIVEKRLYRSRDNRVIAGVCGGVAEYFNIDPTIIRIIWVVIGLTYGAGILAYILASIIIPNRNFESSSNTWSGQSRSEDFGTGFNPDDWRQESPKYDSEKSRNTVGIILIAVGVIFLARQLFSWIDLKVVLPIVFIGAGALLIFNSRRNPQ